MNRNDVSDDDLSTIVRATPAWSSHHRMALELIARRAEERARSDDSIDAIPFMPAESAPFS